MVHCFILIKGYSPEINEESVKLAINEIKNLSKIYDKNKFQNIDFKTLPYLIKVLEALERFLT